MKGAVPKKHIINILGLIVTLFPFKDNPILLSGSLFETI